MFDHRDGCSQRKASKKFNCSQQYISKTIKSKTRIRVYKKKRIPKRTNGQKDKIKIRCDRLYRKLESKSCVIDDESYFTKAHSTINGNNNFYSSDVSQTIARVRFQPQAKFEEKMLVWTCLSDRGVSKPYFVPSGLAVNQNVYLEECIKKRLVPFIEKHHSDGQYLFWPDLATSHYAKTVVNYFEEKNVNFVAKEDNPPNVPECRPVEHFWGILKGLVYENNWQAKDLNQLRSRITKCLKNIDIDLVKSLMESVRYRVGQVRKYGVVEQNSYRNK